MLVEKAAKAQPPALTPVDSRLIYKSDQTTVASKRKLDVIRIHYSEKIKTSP